MPSSITLTVAHLPTSTSFFLSALQPLNYAYRGRSNNTIGFGSTSDPSAPPDFWISQEIPGVPAGAAHVAFTAPSRLAVQHFFSAALKAGGNIHGEPAVRDEKGYYSSAVIDFDGNSVEAVFRPVLLENGNVDARSISSKISTAETSSRKIGGDDIGGMVSQAQSAVNVARTLIQSVSSPSHVAVACAHDSPSGTSDSNNIKDSNDHSGIVGTLLGVAAGAALHYVFTRDQYPGQKIRPSSPMGRSTTDRSRAATPYRSRDNTYNLQTITGSQYITLEDNDTGHLSTGTMRSGRSKSLASSHSDGGRGNSIYATGVGDNSTTVTQRPKTKGAAPVAPESSSFKALSTVESRSHVSRHSSASTIRAPRSSSNQVPAESLVGSRKFHTSRRSSNSTIKIPRSSSSSYPPPEQVPAASSAATSTTSRRSKSKPSVANSLTTPSKSVKPSKTSPSQSVVAISDAHRNPTPKSKSTTSNHKDKDIDINISRIKAPVSTPTPLSEANLALATNAYQQTEAHTQTKAESSLHRRAQTVIAVSKPSPPTLAPHSTTVPTIKPNPNKAKTTKDHSNDSATVIGTSNLGTGTTRLSPSRGEDGGGDTIAAIDEGSRAGRMRLVDPIGEEGDGGVGGVVRPEDSISQIG